MKIHPDAQKLNETIQSQSPAIFSMITSLAKKLYFPKGIITQTAEAKQHGCRYNATVGIATEKGIPMHLDCIAKHFGEELSPEDLYPYAPALGIVKLRELWQNKIRQQNPSLNQNFSLPLVTHALSNGLSLAADLFIEEGDPVILPEKFWGNYRLTWELKAKGVFQLHPFYNENLNGVDVEGFARTMSQHRGKKQVIILNYPNNPTGYTPTRKEAQAIVAALINEAHQGSRLVVICDDAYYGMFYEDACEQESFFALLANAHQNILAVKIDGATKEAFVWGFRVGFMTFATQGGSNELYSALEQKAAGAIRASNSSSSLPMQSIILKGFSDKNFQKEWEQKFQLLKARYHEVKRVCLNPDYSSLWTVYPFNSGYFMCLKIKGGVKAETLRQHLIKAESLGTVSVSESDLRIAFSCLEIEDIATVFAKIASGVRALR